MNHLAWVNPALGKGGTYHPFCGIRRFFHAWSPLQQKAPPRFIYEQGAIQDTFYFLTLRICSGRRMIPRLKPDG
jgi:hypothetical protein